MKDIPTAEKCFRSLSVIEKMEMALDGPILIHTSRALADAVNKSEGHVKNLLCDMPELSEKLNRNRELYKRTKMERIYNSFKNRPKGVTLEQHGKRHGLSVCMYYKARDYMLTGRSPSLIFCS